MAQWPLSRTTFALVLILLLTVQIGTNIRQEAEETSGRLIDVISFYGVFFVGALLVGDKWVSCLRWRVLFPCILFFAHLIVLVVLDTDTPWISYILPNYGIVSWMALGMLINFAISTIAERLASQGNLRIWSLVYWIPVFALVSLAYWLRNYAEDAGRIASYQFPASNLIVLLLFGLLALNRWQLASRNRATSAVLVIPPAILFLVVGTYLTYLVSLMNSTGIVGMWGLLSIALLWRFGYSQGWRFASVLILAIMAGVWWASGLEAVARFFEQTRFNQFQSGGFLEFSSITTREDFLIHFWEQFDVNPVFGHMRAEVAAGFIPGGYVHSLPLSVLTHTGLVGAILLFSAILLAIKPEAEWRPGKFTLVLFGITTLFASAFTFFTWIPFWFMMGYLIAKPRPMSSYG